MYGIFTYILLIFRANVGKYSSTMGCIWVRKPNKENIGKP
jgi:hypothetical protein